MRTLFFIFLLNLAHSYEVLTISDSIVDHIVFVDDEYIASIPGKGGSELVDDVVFNQIIPKNDNRSIIRPGASAVNMLKGLNELGHTCSLITTIGDDEQGDFFLQSLKEKGITLFLKTIATPTGKSACLVTPNGERTMRTYLGASTENHRLQLNERMFQGVSHFHLEGYQLKHRHLVNEAVRLAKQNSATVSVDLSSFEVVKANKDYIWELLQNGHIDLLFANHEEATTLTGLAPKESSEMLSHFCEIAIVTLGEEGCYVSSQGAQWRCPARNVKVLDTIGAGDLFISGFLHGYLRHEAIPTCACIGTLLASHVIQVHGAEIPETNWGRIKFELEKMHQE